MLYIAVLFLIFLYIKETKLEGILAIILGIIGILLFFGTLWIFIFIKENFSFYIFIFSLIIFISVLFCMIRFVYLNINKKA